MRPTGDSRSSRPRRRVSPRPQARSPTSASRLPKHCCSAPLEHAPEDVVALRMLAHIAAARENYPKAERLLGSACASRPATAARGLDLVQVLQQQMRGEPMLPLLERLLAAEPRNQRYRTLQAVAYNLLGRTECAIGILEALVNEFPRNEGVWLNYGHTLRIAGRYPEAIHAYRKGIELQPGFGGAWVALADLKTYRFSRSDVAAIELQLARRGIAQRGAFAAGVRARQGAGGRRRVRRGLRALCPWQRAAAGCACITTARTSHASCSVRTALYTREFLAARAGWGSRVDRPHFHHRAPTCRLDASRADPRQSFSGGGYARADRRDPVCDRTRRRAKNPANPRPTRAQWHI